MEILFCFRTQKVYSTNFSSRSLLLVCVQCLLVHLLSPLILIYCISWFIYFFSFFRFRSPASFPCSCSVGEMMSLSRMVSAKEIIRHEEFPEVLELLLCQRSLVVLIHGLRIPDSIINSTYMRICDEFNVSPRTISRGEDEEVDVRVEEIKKSLIALSPSWSVVIPSSSLRRRRVATACVHASERGHVCLRRCL